MSPGTSILNPSGDNSADHGAMVAWQNSDLPWSSRGLAAIDHFVALNCQFGADDVQALVPAPDHPNRVGGLFMAAHKAGLIRPVGYRSSTRASRHGGVQRLWIGAR